MTQEGPCLGSQVKWPLVNSRTEQAVLVAQSVGGEEAELVLKAPVVLEDVWAPCLRDAEEAACGGPQREIPREAQVQMYAASGHRKQHPWVYVTNHVHHSGQGHGTPRLAMHYPVGMVDVLESEIRLAEIPEVGLLAPLRKVEALYDDPSEEPGRLASARGEEHLDEARWVTSHCQSDCLSGCC